MGLPGAVEARGSYWRVRVGDVRAYSTTTFWSSAGRLKSRLVVVQGAITRVVGVVERRAPR